MQDGAGDVPKNPPKATIWRKGEHSMPQHKLLMCPGPTIVPDRVLQAGAEPMVYHRSEEFSQVLKEVLDHLRVLFGTHDVLVMASSGRGAVEAALANSLTPGGRVLVVVNGFFGEMMAGIARDLGFDVVRTQEDWTRPADPQAVADVLAGDPSIEAVGMVHSETSTSVLNDLASMGQAVRGQGRLLVVDAVSSLGGAPIDMDRNLVDVVGSASQKGLFSPPGIGVVGVGAKGWERINLSTNRRHYFDLRKMKEAADRPTPQTPSTTPVSLVKSLHAALQMINEETVAGAYRRHERMAQATRLGVKALGLSLYPAGDFRRSPTVTTVALPEGRDPSHMLKWVEKNYGIVLGNGLGKIGKTTFRVGHMGVVQPENVVQALGALGDYMVQNGWTTAPADAGAKVAQEYFDRP